MLIYWDEDCCIYLSFVTVFCCFGHLYKQTNSLTLIIFIPQAFVAIATSSGGIQTSIDKDINWDVKITTMKKWKLHIKKKRGKVDFKLQLFKLTIARRWLLKKLCWIIQILTCPLSSPSQLLHPPRLLLPGFSPSSSACLVFGTYKVEPTNCPTTP